MKLLYRTRPGGEISDSTLGWPKDWLDFDADFEDTVEKKLFRDWPEDHARLYIQERRNSVLAEMAADEEYMPLTELDFVQWFEDCLQLFDQPHGFRRALYLEDAPDDYSTQFSSEDEEMDCDPSESVLFGTCGRRSAQSLSPTATSPCAHCKLETRWCDCQLQPSPMAATALPTRRILHCPRPAHPQPTVDNFTISHDAWLMSELHALLAAADATTLILPVASHSPTFPRATLAPATSADPWVAAVQSTKLSFRDRRRQRHRSRSILTRQLSINSAETDTTELSSASTLLLFEPPAEIMLSAIPEHRHPPFSRMRRAKPRRRHNRRHSSAAVSLLAKVLQPASVSPHRRPPPDCRPRPRRRRFAGAPLGLPVPLWAAAWYPDDMPL